MRFLTIVLIFLFECVHGQDVDYSTINAKCNVIDSIRQGDCINTDSTGRIISIIKFVDGVKDGYAFNFYRSGTVSEVKFWMNGVLKKSISYYPNGVKEWDASFDDRKENSGDYFEYYDNGKLKLKATYKPGLPFADIGNVRPKSSVDGFDTATAVFVGKFEEFYKSGKTKTSGFYNEDSCHRKINSESTPEAYSVSYGFHPIKDGNWRYFDESGVLIKEEEWVNGKLEK